MPYLTPNWADFQTPAICRRLILPAKIWPYVSGALEDLANAEHWEQHGDMSPAEIAAIFADAGDDMYDDDCVS